MESCDLYEIELWRLKRVLLFVFLVLFQLLVIKADKIDKYGNPRRYRAIEEGDCKFPFKYNNRTYQEDDGCADSKDTVAADCFK